MDNKNSSTTDPLVASNESDYQNKLDQLSQQVKPEPPAQEPSSTQPTPQLPPKPESKPTVQSDFKSVNNLPPHPPVLSHPLPEDKQADKTSDSPNKKTNIFKYLFFVSLIIFLTIVALVVNSLFGQDVQTQVPQKASTSPSAVTASPTPSSDQYCELNDQFLSIGITFPAADGCNTCTCQPDLTISCTKLDCQSL